VEDLTPDYDSYDNNLCLVPDHGDLEVTPEMGDNFLSAEISNKDGNPVGLANANPILDTCEYTFTFNYGDETVLNVNLIAEAMYAQ
jgi:hypothetical protein